MTSVSVVMETGNGKHTYYSDALGHPLSKPHIASQVASPINLLNPDRYEFYTFNDDGELVKRLMTLEEIQGIIAGGDGESINYNSENSEILNPNNDVSGVVENVQNVLKEEIESHRNPPLDRPLMDTPDVSATWNMILPAFFGDSMMSDAVTIRESDEDSNNYISVSQKNNDISTTEHMKMSSRMPEESEGNVLSNEYNLPVEATTVFTTESKTEHQTQNNKESLSTVPFNITSATTEKMDKLTSMTTSESSLPTMQDIFTLDLEKISTVTEALDAATEEIIDDGPAAGKTASSATTEDSKTTNTVPLITERVNAHASTIEAEPSTVDQTIDNSKITELVSMITRPTTKPNNKITSTMSTTSVTFPQSSQFTDSEQISLNSTTRLPELEVVSTAAADIVSDDFVILSHNSDNKNDNLLASSGTTTTKYSNKNESTTSYLENTTRNITTNVEQIIADVPNDIINKNANVPVVDYNATTIIEDILNSPTKSPALSNKIMTLASFILDKNRISSNTLTTASTIKTSESELTTAASKESTISLQEISTTRPIPQTTRKNIVSSTTIMQQTRPISSTLLVQQNSPITSASSTTPKLQTTTQSKTSTIKITTNAPSTKITSTTSTKTTERTTTTLVQRPSSPTTIKLTQPPSTTAIKTTQSPTTTTLRTTQTTSSAPTTKTTTTESQKPLTDNFLANRFGIGSTELTKPSSTSTQFTKIIQTTSTTGLTKPKTTTELMTTPFIVTNTKKLTTESSKPQTTASTTVKPTTNPVTFITIKQNKTQTITTNKPTSTTKVRITTLNTSPTTRRTTTTSTTNNPTKTSPTATTLSTTAANSTTFAPSRKTEEVLQFDKMTTINDSWKLVETVKPPETTPSKIVNLTSPIPTITTSKPSYRPSIEPYQPAKVDLSSQGNFGMPSLSEDMSVFSKMYNELALKFWNALSVKNINSERSTVVSPFGAISMLAMIFLGARGGTSGEMNDVLKLDDIVTFNPHLVLKEVTDSVIARKSSSAIVRELYSDMYRGKVQDFYKERVRFFYEGHVEEIDFKKIHNVIRRRTNALISKQTRGQLPQYLEETTLTLRAPLSALSTNVFQVSILISSYIRKNHFLDYIK